MTRGLGGESPANVSFRLKGIVFPARRQDLIQQAQKNGALPEVLQIISHMPENRYENMADVMKAYGEVERARRAA